MPIYLLVGKNISECIIMDNEPVVFADLQVAEIDLDPDVFDEVLPNGLTFQEVLEKHASFNHKEACEYIVYVGYELDAMLQTWISYGIPADHLLLALIEQANFEGYKYLCVYC